MKKTFISRAAILLLAIVCCLSLAVPALAATAEDAKAPLTSISIETEDATDYTLAPVFQQNTKVYTVTTSSTMPTTAEEALSYIDYVAPNGTNVVTGFNTKTNTLDLTATNDAGSTKYYVVFSNASSVSKTNVADINVKKVLEIDPNAGNVKLDSLSFTYELESVKIVANTSVAGNTTIPITAATAAQGTAATGTATITNETGKSKMVLDNWNGANVTKVTSEQAATMGNAALEGQPMIDGKFSLTFDKVGQYVYLLHEVAGTSSGVTYDDSYYEITVSAVHVDPDDPTSAIVIGWIEVKAVDTYTSNTDYTLGAKVNFGTTTDTNDGNKYDNMTASITYPFINELATDDLVVAKAVTGDLGDAAQDFSFTITVNGTDLASSYVVSYNSAAGTRAETITTNGSTGTLTTTLKHGETVTISDLPCTATYNVVESNEGEAANYNTTITNDASVYTQADADATVEGTDNDDVTNAMVKDIKTRDVTVGKTITAKTVLNTLNDFNTVDVVNDKPLTPPTGAFMDMVPYIAIVVVAIGGFVAFVAVKKRRAYED